MLKMAMQRRHLLGVALGAAFLSALPVSPRLSSVTAPSLSLDRAEARIGHPLSPGSIAGVNRRVNRRTARRAYYGVAAAGAAGYNNLYNYAPGANAGPAPAADQPAAAGGADFTVQNSPALYVACLHRTFGACPTQ